MTADRNDGRKLAAARKAAGKTLDDVLVAVRTQLPEELWASKSTLARWEKATAVDPTMVAFFADLYQADFGATFPEAKDALRAIPGLLVALSGWLRDQGDEGGRLVMDPAA